MSLDLVRSGVIAATAAIEQVVEVVDSTLTMEETAEAIGRAYVEYDDAFARLRVFDINSGEFRTLQSFDDVAQETPTVELDYLLLQNISEVYLERMAPMYTFGTSVVYTSGQDAKTFVYSGVLLADPLTGDNIQRFHKSYENALRAEKLVSAESPGYVELTYRDQIRRGYITSISVQLNANVPSRADVSFTMFVISQSTQ